MGKCQDPWKTMLATRNSPMRQKLGGGAEQAIWERMGGAGSTGSAIDARRKAKSVKE